MRETRNATKNTPPTTKAATPKAGKAKSDQNKGTPKAEKANVEAEKLADATEVADISVTPSKPDSPEQKGCSHPKQPGETPNKTEVAKEPPKDDSRDEAKVSVTQEIKTETAVTKESATEEAVEAKEDVEEERGEDGENAEQEENEEEEEEEEEGDEEGDEGEGDASVRRPPSERNKRRKLEVFVGGLDKEATEDDIKAAFEVVGELLEVRLRINPQTGKNRGYAFVRFATQEQAKKATVELERTKIRDKECNVVPSEDNDTLYIGNLCKSWKSDEILDKLKEYGVEGIDELTLLDDPKNEGFNRGFAFLDFVTHDDAVNAFRRLSKPDAIFGSDYSAKVSWAEPFVEPDEAAMAKVKSVYVDSLPLTWNESKLKDLFSPYGTIEGVVMSKNLPKSKRRDFAFIDFTNRDEALACIKALNDVDIPDGDKKIRLKVELSKPAPRKKHQKSFRGSFPVGGASSGEKSKYIFSTGGLGKKVGGPIKRKAGNERSEERLKRSTGSERGGAGYSRASRGGKPSVRRDAAYRDDYVPASAIRHHGYADIPIREELYPRRGYAYEMAYLEPHIGVKRPLSALDEEAMYYEAAAQRGYARARVDYDYADLAIARAPLASAALGSREGGSLYGASVLPSASDYLSELAPYSGAMTYHSSIYGARSSYY